MRIFVFRANSPSHVFLINQAPRKMNDFKKKKKFYWAWNQSKRKWIVLRPFHLCPGSNFHQVSSHHPGDWTALQAELPTPRPGWFPRVPPLDKQSTFHCLHILSQLYWCHWLGYSHIWLALQALIKKIILVWNSLTLTFIGDFQMLMCRKVLPGYHLEPYWGSENDIPKYGTLAC